MLYHVVIPQDWDAQSDAPNYSAASLAAEGFIHFSTAAQWQGVIERYYIGVFDIVLLEIDEDKLKAPLKYEAATDNELFPHLYGELNKDAIDQVYRLQRETDTINFQL